MCVNHLRTNGNVGRCNVAALHDAKQWKEDEWQEGSDGQRQSFCDPVGRHYQQRVAT